MLYDRGLPENELYTRWIEMYNAPEFAELADWLRSFIDQEAEQSGQQELAQMQSAFTRGSQYEYMFWDAAWRLEEWEV